MAKIGLGGSTTHVSAAISPIVFEHPRGTPELQGNGYQLYNGYGCLIELASTTVFNAIEMFLAKEDANVGNIEVRAYAASGVANAGGALDLTTKTLLSTVTIASTGLTTTPALTRITFPNVCYVPAGGQLLIMMCALGASKVKPATFNSAAAVTPARWVYYLSSARDFTGFAGGSNAYQGATVRLLALDPTVQAQLTSLQGSVPASGALLKTTGYVEATPKFYAYQHARGAAEMVGDGDYSIAGYTLGFTQNVSNTAFNAIKARVWTGLSTAVKWAVYVENVGAAINLLTSTPVQSGILTAGAITSLTSAYKLVLTAPIPVIGNKAVTVLFWCSNSGGDKIYIRRWVADTYSDRLGFRLANGEIGVTNTNVSTGSIPNYGATSIELLNESEEIRSTAGTINASGVNYSNVSSGMSATNAQTAMDELAARQYEITPRIILPANIKCMVGEKIQLFYRSIVETPLPLGVSVEARCTVGKNYLRYFEYTPVIGDVGNKTLTINVLKRDGTTLSTASTTLEVYNNTPFVSSAKNLLIVGDSLTGGTWPIELHRRVALTGGTPAGLGLSNVSFVGTSTNVGGAKWEGRGGWTWQNYLGTGINAYWVTCTHDKDVSDQKSMWADTNANQWQMETIESGRIKMLPYAHAVAMPATGTLTWVSGGTHNATITYTAIALEPGSPFWNAGTSAVDFANYCTAVGASGIDYCAVLLGWNQGVNGETADFTAAGWATVIGYAKQFIDQLHIDYPSAKVMVMGLQVPSMEGGLAANYGATDMGQIYRMIKATHGLNLAYEAMCAEAGYSGFCTYVPLASQFDSDYNMPFETIAVNSRSSVTERRGTNGVHPDTPGYLQIADAAYRTLCKLLRV